MIDTGLMKITGLYYVLDSRSPKIFGHNVFKCMSVVGISILLLLTVIFLTNIYYFSNDINVVMLYLMLFTSDVLTILKLYVTIAKSDTIWNCIQMTSIDDLSYKYHDRSILRNGQLKSKSYSILIMFMWLNLMLSWGLAPLFVTNYFIEAQFENKVYRYRFYILGFVFPVTDQFYNDNFMIYYYIEFACLIIWCHSTMNFDVLLLSMNITFKYQLKTIANSFSTFNIAHYIKSKSYYTYTIMHYMLLVSYTCKIYKYLYRLPFFSFLWYLDNLTTNVKNRKESELMFDFKSMINDQQRVIE